MSEPAPSSYDEMPYVNMAFPQTHPDRLATLARLFGMTPPVLETCRVLELGCASGGNLIPMALDLPSAQFLGIDLSGRQIEQARQTVKTLGLKNIELRHGDIASVDASYGQFDYIVCHGIYSWVPERIREKILAVCHDNLVPDGVAYVSYNTLPGWRVRGMIRDIMLYHSAQFQGAPAQVQQARAVLDFLAQSVPTNTPYGMTLRQEVDVIRNEPDAYLFHDHLEDVNEPVYFHQFAECAQRHGLQYLAEADFSSMVVSNHPPQVADTLRRIAPNILRMEQFLDFMRNRTFRQTLLIHQGVAIQRNLDGQSLKGLYLASRAQPASKQPSIAQGVAEEFRTPNGSTVTTVNAITKAALLLLEREWPLGMRLENLAGASRAGLFENPSTAPDAATLADDELFLGNEMLQCYAGGVVEVRLRPPRFSVTPSVRPVASPLARLQAELADKVTNLRHEPVVLDAYSRRLLPLLDGTRDREELVAALAKLAADRTLEVREQQSGKLLTAGPTLGEVLRNALEVSLPKLAKAALLLA